MDYWAADQFGDPKQVLKRRSRPRAEPKAGQALIRVLACGVGLPDALMTRGVYPGVKKPPVTPGQEVVGIVEEIGEGSSSFGVGDRVVGSTLFQLGWGGFADHCLSATTSLFAVPEGMADVEAAGFLIPFHTAYVSLVNRARVQPGETVLILGGAGSSGSAAIQLAKALGARVCATARNEAKTKFCYDQGADLVVDIGDDTGLRRLMDFTYGRGVDVVFDTAGGSVYQRSTEVLARFGRVVLVGFASGQWAQPDALDMVLKSYSVIGALMPVRTAEERSACEADLAQFYRNKKIGTPIDSVFGLAEVPDAIARVERSATCGKVVVSMTNAPVQ